MRLALALLPVALLASASCSDATGSLKGGEALLAPPADCTLTGPACSTWTHVYACYFGPNGKHGGCSSQGQCHGSAMGTGAVSSGFVCGTSQAECWKGMTMSTNQFLPTLVRSGVTNFKATYLYQSIYKDGTTPSSAANNMPVTTFGGPPFMPGFTPAELSCMDGWVSAGAKND
jgi:hypothetical protein